MKKKKKFFLSEIRDIDSSIRRQHSILKNRNRSNKMSREINADFWNLEAEEEEEFLNSNVAY